MSIAGFQSKFIIFEEFQETLYEVRNSLVTKSSYETVLRKMTSQFELLIPKIL